MPSPETPSEFEETASFDPLLEGDREDSSETARLNYLIAHGLRQRIVDMESRHEEVPSHWRELLNEAANIADTSLTQPSRIQHDADRKRAGNWLSRLLRHQ